MMWSRASNAIVFDGWHNVEIHVIPGSRRESFYVGVKIIVNYLCHPMEVIGVVSERCLCEC